MLVLSEDDEFYNSLRQLIELTANPPQGEPLDAEMPDLTPWRYSAFQKQFGETEVYKKCLSKLQKASGPNYSAEVLQYLLVDLVYAVPSSPRKAVDYWRKLEQEHRKFVLELEKPVWTMHSVGSLKGFLWKVPDDRECEMPIMPGVKLFIDMEEDCPAGSLEVVYETQKRNLDYSYLFDVEKPVNLVEQALLALRLLKAGDVGIDFIRCKPVGRSWPTVISHIELVVPATGSTGAYELEKDEEGELACLADQLNLVLGNINDSRINVAIEGFMKAYARDYVDRLEGYLRTLQALFMKRGDPLPKLSQRVSKFLAKDANQLQLIEKDVRRGYGLRSRVSHGNLSPSQLEQSALALIGPVEDCCRRSILYFIALARIGEIDSTLKMLDSELNANELEDTKRRAWRAFWVDRRIVSRANNGTELFLNWDA